MVVDDDNGGGVGDGGGGGGGVQSNFQVKPNGCFEVRLGFWQFVTVCETECEIVHQSKRRFECVIECQIFYINKYEIVHQSKIKFECVMPIYYIN